MELCRVVWQGQAKMIERMTGLRDLIYHCKKSFPVDILDVLHAGSRTRCRLHIEQTLIGPGTPFIWNIEAI